MLYFLELSINGAIAGALYALAALAFVVVYKATRVMNFALGELVMFAIGLVAAGLHVLGLALVPAIAFGATGMFVIAAGFNQVVLRHLVGQSELGMIMVTIGFGAMLRALAAFLFAGIPRDLELPLARATTEVGGVLLSLDELAAAGIAVVLIAAVGWLFDRTRRGISLRCIADDRQAALAMGIDVRAGFAFVWGLAGVIAVAAGVLWTYTTGGGFNMVLVGLKVFPIVIIGGLDSILGVIVGALLVGWIESLAAGYLDPVIGGGFSHVTAYLLLIAMLLVRPAGLLGRGRIDRP